MNRASPASPAVREPRTQVSDLGHSRSRVRRVPRAHAMTGPAAPTEAAVMKPRAAMAT